MWIKPLGIFGANQPLEAVGDWARQDTALTHPNPISLRINAIFTIAIAHSTKPVLNYSPWIGTSPIVSQTS